jgi:AcrR family transcriptional regulator
MHVCRGIIVLVCPAARSRQADRSAGTRQALLDATVMCLVEDGYVGITGPAIADRAGLSRGAQLHHFGTRDQLVVAAVEHLAQMRLGAVREKLDELNLDAGSDLESTAGVALELLAAALSGPLYAASLELWVAARANVSLRSELLPVEGRVRKVLEAVCRDYVSADPVEIELTLDLLLGQGVSGLFDRDGAMFRQARGRWRIMMGAQVGAPAGELG